MSCGGGGATIREVGKSGKIMCEDLWVMIRAGPNGRLERENRIFTGENTCAQGPGGGLTA